jgi:hypothetical protein
MNNPILARAKQHWLSKIAETRIVEVAEWGVEDVPLRIWVRPATLAVRDKIYQSIKDGSLRGLAVALVTRARDEDGQPMFTEMDIRELMNEVDPDVLARVVEEMNEDLNLTADEAEGN